MKKLSGIFFLFILLVSAGTIYANSNSAQNLSKWYENSFQEESKRVGAETATGIIRMINEINTFLKESKVGFDAAMETFRSDTVTDTNSNIEGYKDELITDINETVVELKQENFDDYVKSRNIEEEITQDIESILEEILSE